MKPLPESALVSPANAAADEQLLKDSAAGRTFKLPAAISAAGEKAEQSYVEFFLAAISNPNTRQTYLVVIQQFCRWVEATGLDLLHLETYMAATYIRSLQEMADAPAIKTVKLHLSALRSFFAHLLLNQLVKSNPFAGVRSPRYSQMVGKTPILAPETIKTLFQHINTDDLRGLRDRALIGVMGYTFARVSAVCKLKVGDYVTQGRISHLYFNEKRGKTLQARVHHVLVEYLDDYLAKAGIAGEKDGFLFRPFEGFTAKLKTKPLNRCLVYQMVRRRFADASIKGNFGCHTFRATGITTYLQNGGTVDTAQKMAGHAAYATTKLYDRRTFKDEECEVERVIYL